MYRKLPDQAPWSLLSDGLCCADDSNTEYPQAAAVLFQIGTFLRAFVEADAAAKPFGAVSIENPNELRQTRRCRLLTVAYASGG